MITGYNTDVSHSDVVFHVQTEDKGLGVASIESLVYVGGQILGKRRTSYKSVLDRGEGKQAIVELMDRQHRLMIAEIRNGKYDADVGVEAVPPAPETVLNEKPIDIIHDDEPAEIEHVAAPHAAESGSQGQTLDQIILEYLNTEAEQEHLILMMDVEEAFSVGESAVLNFRTKGSVSGDPVPGTRIAIKMISTVSEPMALADGETDGEGNLGLSLDVPDLRRGHSALIVTATSAIGTAEIKHLL
jgi:hypothetical protein